MNTRARRIRRRRRRSRIRAARMAEAIAQWRAAVIAAGLTPTVIEGDNTVLYISLFGEPPAEPLTFTFDYDTKGPATILGAVDLSLSPPTTKD